jgi:hypothetical protein
MPKLASTLRRLFPRARAPRAAAAQLRFEPLEVRDVPAGDGLSAVYFDSANITEARGLVGATTSTVVGTVNTNWGSGKPAGTPAAFGADTWAARFAGSVEATASGTYTFRTYSDDGVRLWVDDRLIVNNWTDHAPTFNTGAITLEAGRKYHIVLEYYENGGGAQLKLEWDTPDGTAGNYGVVPQANLYSDRRVNPPGSNVINVKDAAYGAKGDGKTDDWWAIQKAISDYIGASAGTGTPKILYLPAGTYLVSKTVEWRQYDPATRLPRQGTSNNGWRGGFTLLGENRDNTVIRLADGTFTDDPSYAVDANGFIRSNAVLHTASNKGPRPTDSTNGDGRDAYDNSVLNLTVDTGTGNTGAVGIDYFVNNRGSINNVRVLSRDGQGRVGIRQDRAASYSGLISDVTVDGYNSGLSFGFGNDVEAYTVLDGVRLQNQLLQGINVSGGVTLTAQNVRSINAVPMLRITRDGLVHVTLIDSTAIGTAGAATRPAIVNGTEDTAPGPNQGKATGTGIANSVLVRNFATSGYLYAYAGRVNGTNTTRTGTVTELVSHAVNKNFADAPSTTLNLANKEAPNYYNTDVANDWVKVGGRLAGETDDTEAIRRALATGKPVVYFESNKTYTVTGTVDVPASVRWLVGFNAVLRSSGAAFDSAASPTPILRVAADSPNPLIVDTFTFRLNGAGVYAVRQDTGRTVVLRELNSRPGTPRSTAGFYKAGPSAGELFVQDVAGGGYTYRPGQNIWGRQMDSGGDLNDGANLRILGIRTEGGGTTLTTVNGGRSEILGAQLSINSGGSSSPAFVNDASEVSLSFMATNPGNNTFYPILVRERRAGDTTWTDFLPGEATGTGSNGGRRVALYRG